MWDQIDAIIAENRSIAGSVIAVLRRCQEVVGYLPVELMEYVATGMNLSRSDVFGVASFYALFSFEPKGRHTVTLHPDRLLCQRDQRGHCTDLQ